MNQECISILKAAVGHLSPSCLALSPHYPSPVFLKWDFMLTSLSSSSTIISFKENWDSVHMAPWAHQGQLCSSLSCGGLLAGCRLGRQDADVLAQAPGPAPGWLPVREHRNVLLGHPTDIFWSWHPTLRGTPWVDFPLVFLGDKLRGWDCHPICITWENIPRRCEMGRNEDIRLSHWSSSVTVFIF